MPSRHGRADGQECYEHRQQAGGVVKADPRFDAGLEQPCGGFPDWARRNLSFVDSRIGLPCVELPGILERAQRAQLTSAPNPSYETTEVQVSVRVASRLLQDLSVSDDNARAWGKMLREATEEAKSALAGADHALIE